MARRDGPLVIADISGCTAFIADTELEHSREILTELLETIIGAFDKRLTVEQLAGDRHRVEVRTGRGCARRRDSGQASAGMTCSAKTESISRSWPYGNTIAQ